MLRQLNSAPPTPTPTPVTMTPTPTPTPVMIPIPVPVPTPTPVPVPTPSPTPMGNLTTGTSTGNLTTGTSTGNLTTGTSTQSIFTPVLIVTPAISTPGAPGSPTGQPANTVSDGFYNLSDNNDNILLFSLPSVAARKPIFALSGNDNITGTSGSDIINGMQGADTIDGGAGNDCLPGGKGSDEIDGGAGDDAILGNNDNDTLTGGDGNDIMTGGKENDVLIGGNGDDRLSGDRNQDFLTGGSGNDTFVLAGGQVAATSLTDADVIVDFTAGDKIGLTDGNTFASLTFETVSLNVNAGFDVNSTAIKAGSNYLGIVQGVAQSELTASVFVPEA